MLVIAGLIATAILCVSGWIFLAAIPFYRHRAALPQTILSGAALQISLVAFVLVGIFKGFEAGLVAALFPPVLAIYYQNIAAQNAVFTQAAVFAGPVGALCAIVCFVRLPLRPFTIGACLLSTGLTAVVAGEYISRDAMCATALGQGVDQIPRHSFYWSLRNAPREFQFEIHALIVVDDRRLGWSYSEMGWYEIPDIAQGWVSDDFTMSCL